MAIIRCSVSSPVLIKKQPSFTIKTPANKVLVKMQMITVTHNQANSFSKSSSQVQIRSFSSCSTRSKIFEDESQGIVCYKDELTGETICEGCDEGPRLCPIPIDDINSLQRDLEKSYVKKKKNKLIQLIVNGSLCGEGEGEGEGRLIARELDYTVVNWMDFKSLP